jgi:hypothetical protein
MDLTLLLAIALFIAFALLLILFFKHNKLKNRFNNYDPNPVFGPGRYNYGRDNPYKILKEIRKENRLEAIRKFLTFKWTWYWTTEKYRIQKKAKKDLNKKFTESLKSRKKHRKMSHNIDMSDMTIGPKIK